MYLKLSHFRSANLKKNKTKQEPKFISKFWSTLGKYNFNWLQSLFGCKFKKSTHSKTKD